MTWYSGLFRTPSGDVSSTCQCAEDLDFIFKVMLAKLINYFLPLTSIQ